MGDMRRIVMFNWLTADGYFSGPDGNLNWVVPDDEQARAAVASIATSDTVIFGRVTYERFPEGRHLEEFPSPPRARPARGRGHEEAARRLHRVAAHGARFDRRISIRRLPDVPRKRAVVANRRVEEHEAGAPGGQEVPVRRRLASLRARELTLRRFPRQGSLIVF